MQMEFSNDKGGETLRPRRPSSEHPDAITVDIADVMHWEKGKVSQASTQNSSEKSRKPQKRTRGPGAGHHPCHICGKTYERVDHLSRHIKSHDNARPFQCAKCAKGFNRPDLLRRHTATHGIDGEKTVRKFSSNRARQACKACAGSKSKCEDQKPCRRCREMGLICNYTTATYDLQSSPPTVFDIDTQDISAHRNSSFSALNPSEHILVRESTAYSELSELPLLVCENSVRPAHREQHQQHLHVAPETPRSLLDQSTIGELPMTFPSSSDPTTFSDEFAPQFIFDWQESMLFPNDASSFGQDLDFHFSDFDWHANEYCSAKLPIVVKNHAADESGSVFLRHEAFKRSPWFWVPTSNDYAFAGQEDVLTIDEEYQDSSPDITFSTDLRVVEEKIDQAVRDKLFLVVAAESSRGAPVRSFPSAELLNNLLQIYFFRDNVQSDRWIHAATFKTREVIPELLIAIISAGSTFISDPAIWKMGLALQEITRFAVAANLEKDNRNTRDLANLQSFMLWTDIGLWCGFNRIMEIAEAFEQPLLTMLRRAGALTRQRYPTIRPEPDDTGEVLVTKWLAWVKNESWKRLVLHLFMRDMQNSIANRTNPLVSYTEMCLPLPACCKLWNAKTAEDWKSTYLAMENICHAQAPSLVDCLHKIASLELCRDHVDVKMSLLAILFGYWGQIWTYNESRNFQSKGSRAASQLRLTSQQQELHMDLENFSSRIEQITGASAETTLVSQLLMMSLYVSIEDLQRFAGKSGEEESRRAHPTLRDWIESTDARQAAWHAGQVLRAARWFPPTQLRGFYSIGLYHASLTLWAYGLASRASTKRGTTGTTTPVRPVNPKTEVQILLNGAECRESRNFLHFGQGNPGLETQLAVNGSVPGFAPVEDSRMLMAIARHISRSNFSLRDEPLPPLVENIGNLMKDLGDLATVPLLQRVQPGSG